MKNLTIKDGSSQWNLEKVLKPQRYLWHVTTKEIRLGFQRTEDPFGLRKKILKEGLICNDFEKWALFANNGLTKPQFLFPFCIDHFMFGDGVKRIMENMMTDYDFWRIDTLLYNGDWYIDPKMEAGIKKTYTRLNKYWYLCTKNNIPPSALTLFTFKETNLNEIGKLKLNFSDGAASVSTNRWQDNLTPHIWEDDTLGTLKPTKPLLAA